MYRLVYVSSAVNLFSEDQLKELLEVSRRNNGADGITGMLLYVEGNFIQVLEGEQPVVLKTHDRIAKDPRHTGLITLLQGDQAEREFADWSMGFKKVQASDAASLPGYSDFLSKGTDMAKQRSAALRLLENFRQINK
jgi:hypothetical protein